MATRTIANGGGSWTANGTWVEGTAPTNADDVVATATSGDVTISSNGVCRSADFTGYVGTLTQSANLNIGNATGGSLKFVPGMGYTRTAGTIQFLSTTTGNTVTLAGKVLTGPVTFNGAGGGWTLQDAFNLGNQQITVVAGTLNLNGQTITMGSFVASGSSTRVVTFGAATVTSTGTTWDFSGTGLTLSAASVVVNFARTSTTQTFTPAASQTWGTFNITNAASFIIATTATTITNFSVTPTTAISLTLPAGVTTTISNAPTLRGIPGSLLTILSSSAGSAATVSVAAGTIRANHASIKDSTVTGGATFQAYDSINVSGNTGWTFQTAKRTALAGVG